MKYLVITTLAVTSLFGCAAYQKKIVTLREKIECRVEAVLPIVDYLTDEQLEQTLLNADVADLPELKAVAEAELNKVKAELKACK